MNIKMNKILEITPEMLAEKFKDELAEAGIDKIENISLCQNVDAGEIVATDSVRDGGVPGLNLELHLPAEAFTSPILLVRLEQPKGEGVKAFLYGRHDSYAAYMDVDTRSDKDFDADPDYDSLVVGGDTDNRLKLYTENQYVQFCGRIK